MLTIAINKICRHKYFNKFYMTDHEKISQYLEQCTISFKSWFKYLSIYIFINQQPHFTLLDLNKRMVTFNLAVGDKHEKNDKKDKTIALSDIQYPLYKNIPKGFELDNGLDQTPKVLIPKNTIPLGKENERKSIRFSQENPIFNKKNREEKEDLNNSQYLDLFRNLNENGTKLLNCN